LANRDGQNVLAPAASTSRLQQAATLVPEAAAILDEEMAAGMLAAHHARAAPSGSSSRRRTSNESLRGLPDFVDALGKVLPRIWGYAAGARTRAAEVGPDHGDESVPLVCPRAFVRPGGSTKISMRLNNDDANPANVTLSCTDLFNTSGTCIPKHQVTLTPSQFDLGPDANAEVALEISVPPGSRPGTYSGLLLAAGLAYLRAVITIEVV
jgi:hypothetical protein